MEPCGSDPVTGFYRDGCCSSGPEDYGSHTICAVVTAEFLAHQRSIGNDLSTPMPQYHFPGLVPGDRWCVTAANWLRAHRDGVAAPVVLASTHERALEVVPLAVLLEHAIDVPPSPGVLEEGSFRARLRELGPCTGSSRRGGARRRTAAGQRWSPCRGQARASALAATWRGQAGPLTAAIQADWRAPRGPRECSDGQGRGQGPAQIAASPLPRVEGVIGRCLHRSEPAVCCRLTSGCRAM